MGVSNINPNNFIQTNNVQFNNSLGIVKEETVEMNDEIEQIVNSNAFGSYLDLTEENFIDKNINFL
jgi:hypothetical protein